MTLQQILYAITVAETHSLNKAAERLYISQPSLTVAVRELEKELGITIFHRSGRGMELTNDGQEFIFNARQLYQQYELLKGTYTDAGTIKRKFGVSAQHYSFAVKAFVETVRQFDTAQYDFAIREVKTYDVIRDVGTFRSEIGVLFMSGLNRSFLEKCLKENGLEFHPLVKCSAYVYIAKTHPLAGRSSISLQDLKEYPCLMFEQGDMGSVYFAEEILSDLDYPRIIRTADRATNLNLMAGLNAYTLCSGIICEELNGSDYLAIPFEDDEVHKNTEMEIGYIIKKGTVPTEIGAVYIQALSDYFRETPEA